jgi:hypothetical protein
VVTLPGEVLALRLVDREVHAVRRAKILDPLAKWPERQVHAVYSYFAENRFIGKIRALEGRKSATVRSGSSGARRASAIVAPL